MSFNNAGNPLSVLHTYANNVAGQPQFQFPATAPPTNVIVFGGGSLDQANDPLFRDPQATQWNFTVERQITASTLLRASATQAGKELGPRSRTILWKRSTMQRAGTNTATPARCWRQ